VKRRAFSHTNDIKNADFMAGRYNFNIPGRLDASIVNRNDHGSSGGFAALVAPGVRNSGTITATLEHRALASGNSFTLDMYGDKLDHARGRRGSSHHSELHWYHDTRASRGTTGTLLLDPYDVFISNERTTSNGSITAEPSRRRKSFSSNATDLGERARVNIIIVTTGGAGQVRGTQAVTSPSNQAHTSACSTGSTLTLSAYHNIML